MREPVLRLPAEHRDIVLTDLPVSWSVGLRLRWLDDIETLGDFADMPYEVAVARLNRQVVETVRWVIRAVVALPLLELRRLRSPRDDPSGRPSIPRARPEILETLLRATTLDEEIRALAVAAAVGMRERNGRLFLARLPFGTVERPTYAALAASAGISGVRVRQLVRRREEELENSNLRLPIATRIVEILNESGSSTTDSYLDLLACDGIPSRPEALAALPSLARLRLVPRIEHDPQAGKSGS